MTALRPVHYMCPKKKVDFRTLSQIKQIRLGRVQEFALSFLKLAHINCTTVSLPLSLKKLEKLSPTLLIVRII
jgi:hypothetical protein